MLITLIFLAILCDIVFLSWGVERSSLFGVFFVTSVLGMCGVAWLCDYHPFTYASYLLHTHPSALVGGFVGYTVIGAVWSLFRWWRFMHAIRTVIATFKAEHPFPVDASVVPDPNSDDEWFDSKREPETIERKRLRWRSQLLSQLSDINAGWAVISFDPFKVAVSPKDYKSTIMTWIGFWPLSMLWLAIDDLILRLWENIYNLLSQSFKRISDHVLSDV